MITKILAAVMLTGTLWVAGDAAVRNFSCCYSGAECCNPPSECCLLAKTTTKSCCATKAAKSVKSCCASNSTLVSANAAAPCCDSAFTLCLRTGDVVEGCCCEVVDGRFLCLLTGELLDECCCIPIE